MLAATNMIKQLQMLWISYTYYFQIATLPTRFDHSD